MLIPPLDGIIRVTSVFGADRGSYRHGGLDLGLVAGSVYRRPVKAPGAGEVAVGVDDGPAEHAGSDGAGWVSVRERGGPTRDAEGVLWRFLHFDEPPNLAVGDTVEPGQTLGLWTRPGARGITCIWTRRLDGHRSRVSGNGRLELFAEHRARGLRHAGVPTADRHGIGLESEGRAGGGDSDHSAVASVETFDPFAVTGVRGEPDGLAHRTEAGTIARRWRTTTRAGLTREVTRDTATPTGF